MVHTSTQRAPQALSLKGSYSRSMRVNGLSDRKFQYVFSRVFIAVMLTFAFGTLPATNVKAHAFRHIATAGAPLATGKEAVNLNQLLPSPTAFVFKHQHKAAETCVTDVLGQFTVSDHTPNVEVFDGNHIKPAHKVGSDFVQVVNTGVTQFLVNTGNLDALTVPASGAFGFPAQKTLGFRQFLFVGAREFQIRDALTITESGQSVNSQINPDGFTCLSEMLRSFIQHQRNVVAAGLCFTDSNSSGVARKGTRPADFQFTNLGQAQNPVPVFESRGSVFGTLLIPLTLELRVFGPTGKEVTESCLQIPQTLLQRDTTDFIEPLMFCCLFKGSQGGRRLVVVNLLTIGPCISTQPQGPVVHISGTPKHFAQLMRLCGSGIEPVCIADLHNTKIQNVSHKNTSQFVNTGIELTRALALANRLPRFLPAVSGRGFLAGFL